MGLFNNREKKLITELHQKSESHLKEISKEIDDLLEDLTTDYNENQEVVSEFSHFVEELQTKLSPEDAKKLLEFSSRLTKVKRCAKKGVEAMRELARDQRKITRETSLEYQEYYYTR
jgi:DNA repair ATPase RecN